MGDLAVKLFVTLVMLIPFRLLLNKIKDYTENPVSSKIFNEEFIGFSTNKSVNWFIITSPKSCTSLILQLCYNTL